jgi:hypothetical protein
MREIDWSSAVVAEGTLSVDLIGESARGWRRRFEGVAALLDQAQGRWGTVGLAKSVVRVSSVREGAEEDLRHFLESVVLQVNTDLGLSEPAAPADDEAGRSADRAMAATFRSFADPQA